MNKIKKRCKRCGTATTNPKGYCDDCQSHFEKLKAQADTNRPNSNERGYDYKWKQFSKAYLLEHPTCVMCGAPATVTDHWVMPADVMLNVYNSFVYDESMYASLCHSCNAKKSNNKDKEIRKQWNIDKKNIPT